MSRIHPTAIVDPAAKIAADAEIGPWCRVGPDVTLMGGVQLVSSVVVEGVTDHLTIGRGARVGAASMVISDIPEGETWGGAPARPMRRFLRETVWLAKQAAGRKGNSDE